MRPGGGVDAAIHEAAGPELLDYCQALGGVSVGEAKITPAFKFPCKYVIHTAGSECEDGLSGERVLLRSCYRESMELCRRFEKIFGQAQYSSFYDKDTLEWGDNWKNKILEGVKKAEFAIIVISENFFGREWTEKELTDFLSRQNRNGQKIILPILHNITVAQLQEKYPAVADIQALDSSKYSCDKMALKFAAQFIKRLKS